MRTLHKATAAKVVTSKTALRGTVVMLPEGTRYRTVGYTFEPLGYAVTRIGVGRDRYEIFS